MPEKGTFLQIRSHIEVSEKLYLPLQPVHLPNPNHHQQMAVSLQ